jgi:hypothetical protein
MAMKHKKNSRLLEAIHETANDFHNSGVFNQKQMQKYDAICLSPVPVEAAKIPIYLDTNSVLYFLAGRSVEPLLPACFWA